MADDRSHNAPAEPDRLGAYPHPREVSELFGHRESEVMFAHLAASDRLHHAWLLSGEEGVGKATFAYRLARYLFAEVSERPEDGTLAIAEDALAFKQTRTLAHPNLFVLRRQLNPQTKRPGLTIPVDEVRRLGRFLANTAAVQSRRVIIVDRADELTISAANALLKMLEEPPPATLFLLVSAAPARLPGTVRSRCQNVPFSALGADDLERAVRLALETGGSAVPGSAQFEDVLTLAGGRVRRALELLGEGTHDLVRDFLGLMESLPAMDRLAAKRLADGAGRRGGDADYHLLTSLLSEWIAAKVRQAILVRAPMPGMAGYGDGPEPEALAAWAELWETTVRAKAEADALNLDRVSFILDALFQLQRTSFQTAEEGLPGLS